ncbi:MAG: TIGR03668 family PPOX class F420-dependent oxidoreductase [Candidatus Rokubacteria bacterium]|nr:TIGR03668 family PPOX class F420-dependent oxidoreductase [Candidatus Rokubacteria bacterium]
MAPAGTSLPPAVARFIADARVARLATADRAGQPLVLPICYAWDGSLLYSAIDGKPKRGDGRPLRRIRNVEENPRVSVVIDHYAEDWAELRWVVIDGDARVHRGGPEYRRGVELLTAKYPQYRALRLDPEAGAMIAVTPRQLLHWGAWP